MTTLHLVAQSFAAVDVGSIVAGVVVAILFVVVVCVVWLDERWSDEANTHLYEARRRLDVQRHLFEVHQDAEQVRRELRDELK